MTALDESRRSDMATPKKDTERPLYARKRTLGWYYGEWPL